MASRLVTAVLTIDGVQGVITGFKQAGQAAVEYGQVSMKAGAKASAWVDKHNRQIDQASGSLLKIGAVGAVALGGLVKSAIDWESAWVGVTKTVSGTPEQLAAIEQGLRDMAKELPATHAEIAAVAEAAGQLGVKTEDIEAFTRTMIDLGETTNLSSEEAATSLQQMMNVMGTAGEDVSRLGSAVVALGNNGASTERDIVSMAQRIAAAGTQVNMSEADVLGMASALASVGIEAEAGGTAISLTLKQIDGYVREGGEGLETLAKISGVSAKEFANAWKKDAGVAVADLVEGLGAMKSRGEDVNGVLSDLGFTGIRQSDALLRLAGATKDAGTEQDLLREALLLGSKAWEENIALADEARNRYQSRASQAQIAMNSIKDEAITWGQIMLPVFDSALRGIVSVTEAIADMPEVNKSIAIGIAAVGTTAALAAGGIGKAIVAVANLRTGLAALGISARTATVAMGAVGLALTAAGVVLSAWMGRQAEATEHAREYADAIRQQGTVIGETSRMIASQKLQDSGIYDLAQKAGVGLADLTDAALGSEEALARVNAQLAAGMRVLQEKYDANQAEMDALTGLNEMSDEQFARLGDLRAANSTLNSEMMNFASTTREVETALAKETEIVADAALKTAQLTEANAGSTDASEDAADAARDHAEAEQQRAEAMAEAAEATELALDAAQHYGNILLELSGSQIGVEKSIAGLSERLTELNKGGKDNARTLDLQTESGRKNQEALDSVARSSMSYVQTLYEQGHTTEEIAAETKRARDEWVKGAEAMGMSSERAQQLADDYFGIPEYVATSFATPGMNLSQREVDILNGKLQGIPESVRTQIVAIADKGGLAAAEAALAKLERERRVTIRATYVGASNAPVVGRTVIKADGGVVDYYAAGGIREKHVAEIAPAGAWRVWAEPETGGEAYIPLAESKRARSLQIWQETGRRLGVRGYADGAVVASRSQPSATAPAYLTITAAQMAELGAVIRAGSAAGSEAGTAAGISARDASTARVLGRLR